MTNPIVQEVIQAQQILANYLQPTPLEHSIYLSEQSQSQIYLKCEHCQLTGAFKIRGALNKLLSLSTSLIANGVVAVSSGNHGMAVAYAAKLLNAQATIYVPKGASIIKCDMIASLGAKLVIHDGDWDATEAKARAVANDNEQAFISPYNDIKVLAGQGTIAYELLKQLDDIDNVFVAVGGGGLISGIAGFLKAKKPTVRIIGCQPENSCVMYRSLQAGSIISTPESPTLSDATAGGIEQDSLTFDFCRRYVDEFILVAEEDIQRTIKIMAEQERYIIEGAAAVAVSGCLQADRQQQNNVIISCGRNISFTVLQKCLLG